MAFIVIVFSNTGRLQVVCRITSGGFHATCGDKNLAVVYCRLFLSTRLCEKLATAFLFNPRSGWR